MSVPVKCDKCGTQTHYALRVPCVEVGCDGERWPDKPADAALPAEEREAAARKVLAVDVPGIVRKEVERALAWFCEEAMPLSLVDVAQRKIDAYVSGRYGAECACEDPSGLSYAKSCPLHGSAAYRVGEPPETQHIPCRECPGSVTTKGRNVCDQCYNKDRREARPEGLPESLLRPMSASEDEARFRRPEEPKFKPYCLVAGCGNRAERGRICEPCRAANGMIPGTCSACPCPSCAAQRAFVKALAKVHSESGSKRDTA